MIESQLPSLAQRKRTLNLIWLGMVGSVACYWVIHAILMRRPKTGNATALLPVLFIIEAIVCYVGGWWWYDRMMRSVNQQIAPTVFQRLDPRERIELQNRLQTSAIICLSLFEAPPVWGLVNSMIPSPSPRLFEGLAVASAICFILFRLSGYPAIFQAIEKLEVSLPPKVQP